MQIHTNIITSKDFREVHAALPIGVCVRHAEHGSRSRDRKFDFTLDAEPRKGRRLKNTGHRGAGDTYAATWDEWGVALARLFDIDPDAFTTGGGAYESAEHFHWATGGRFANGGPDEMHDNHRWGYPDTVVTGTYHVHECKCGAITRRMAYGRKFAELQTA